MNRIVGRVTSAVLEQLQRAPPGNTPAVSAGTTISVADYTVVAPTTSPTNNAVPIDVQQNESTAAATVQGSVVAVLDQLVGESPRPVNAFKASDLPIGLGVPQKVKAKILANEYIDLGSLITSYTKSGVGYRLGISDALNGRGQASLTFEPNIKVKQITTIETWTTAFQIFVAIYTSKHAAESPALMKYADVIRDLAARGCNWKYYDENFRFLRQEEPSRFPWDNIHSEFLDSISTIRTAQSTRDAYGAGG